MTDREKILKAARSCLTGDPMHCPDECPYLIDGFSCGLDPFLTDIIAYLEEQEHEPEPVVFCGDCKYWNAGTCLNDKVSWQIEDCGCHPDFVTDSTWFCAEGERR